MHHLFLHTYTDLITIVSIFIKLDSGAFFLRIVLTNPGLLLSHLNHRINFGDLKYGPLLFLMTLHFLHIASWAELSPQQQ